MKITTTKEAQKSLSLAQVDLERCIWARTTRDTPPTAYRLEDRQDLLKFYISQWPQHMQDPNHRKLWSDELDMVIESIENYIKSVEVWLKSHLNKPIRSCVPLKKQREQGLLPSVEALKLI